MSTTASKQIIKTDNNPEKAFKGSLKIALIGISLGILCIFVGNTLEENLTYYSKDYEELMAMGIYSLGVLMVLLGIGMPFFSRSNAGKSVLAVYDDHIEGSGFQIAGNVQTFVNFYEKYDKIQSVSTAGNIISINLSDGKSLNCTAYNAEEVASAIRARIL